MWYGKNHIFEIMLQAKTLYLFDFRNFFQKEQKLKQTYKTGQYKFLTGLLCYVIISEI